MICWIVSQIFTQTQPLLMKLESYGSHHTMVVVVLHRLLRIAAISALQICARYFYSLCKLYKSLHI